MSDTGTQAPVQDPTVQDPTTKITRTVQAAPELAKHPGVAIGVASGSNDPEQGAQVTAQAGKSAQTASAVTTTEQAHPGIWGDITGFAGKAAHDVTTVASNAGKVLNAPLNFVQHEYRYLHDVEARHGLVAGIAEDLGIAAGAAGGLALAGPAGAVLGGEAVAGLEGQLGYQDSWARTANGATYRDPNTGQPVSWGRDVASVLGIRQKTGMYSDISGATDAVGDIVLDPVQNAGSIEGQAISKTGASGALNKIWGGTSIDPENVERAYNSYASVRRAFGQIAGMDAGTIARRLPRLAFAADRLGAADSAEEVAQVFKEFSTADMLMSDGRLPTLSLTRYPFNYARDLAEQGEGPLARNALLGPGRWSQRLTRLPEAYDPETETFGNTFNFHDLSGSNGIDKALAYSESAQTRQYVMNAYAEALPGAPRIIIYRNAMRDMLMTAANVHPEEFGDLDPKAQEYINGWLDRLTGGGDPVHAGKFGVSDETSTPGVKIPDGDGGFTDSSDALYPDQMRKGVFPDFTQVHRMAGALKSGSDIWGRGDEWLYNHFTLPVFKRWVLMTPSYALHIALSELIPNSQRLGITRLVDARYLATMGRLGWETDRGETEGMAGWMFRMMGGNIGRNAQRIDRAIEFYQLHEAHMVSQALSAGENVSKEVDRVEQVSDGLRKALMGVPEKLRTSKDFSLYGPEGEDRDFHWQDWLRSLSKRDSSRAAAEVLARDGNDQEAQAAVRGSLENLPDNIQAGMNRSRFFTSEHPPAGITPMDDWAHQIVSDVKSATTSETGGIHTDLLDLMAHGEFPEQAHLEGLEQPTTVLGREVIPDGNSDWQRLASLGYRRVLNPMVNFLSRKPIALATYLKERKLLDKMVENGVYSDDEAMVIASAHTNQEAIRFVHNLHDRTQWSTTMRNFAPFYFAQEQAYRRMGRLLAENPGAFRRYQLMIHGVSNVTNQQNNQGQGYVALPGTGFLGKYVPDALKKAGVPLYGVAPQGLSGSFSSANVIFPLSTNSRASLGPGGYFAPDVGPVVAFPIRALDGLFPELAKNTTNPVALRAIGAAEGASSAIIGEQAMSTPLWKQLIPNTFMQRAIDAGMGTSTSFHSSVIATIQALDYEQNRAMDRWEADGRKGPMPNIVPGPNASTQDKQKFIDRLTNQTRIIYGIRAVLGLGLPVSPEVTVSDFGFTKEINDEIAKQGSVAKGMDVFLKQNPDALAWTIAKSEDPYGAPLPVNVAAEQWAQKNSTLMESDPYAAAWLMPQTKGPYNSAVYNLQIAQGMRVRRAPIDFLNALYVSSGDQRYYNEALPAHQAALTAAGDNTAAKNAEYARWDAYVQSLETANPVWAEAHTGAQKQVNTQQTISQLTEVINSGRAPKGEQTDLVTFLLGQYRTAEQQYLNASGASNYQTAEKDVRDGWQQYLVGVAKEYPQLQPIITSVFNYALS